jgi:imidazolonepropionase-like amidohydrolase
MAIDFIRNTRAVSAAITLCAALLPAQPSPLPPASAPVVELRGGRWFTGSGFAPGSRWMQSGRFIARPRARADSVVRLDGQWLVPPYADAHTHSPDGEWGFDGIRDMYFTEGVFYVQVLANHRSGRIALTGRVNTPTSVDAVFADGAVTSTGGHPQVLYEALALFRTPGGTPVQRQQAARSLSQDGDVYFRLDSLSQLPALVHTLRADTVPLLKVMVLDADHFDSLARDSSTIGHRGIPPDALRALVDSAHAMGRRVWVHIETARDFERALDAGVDGFAHVPGYGVAWQSDSLLQQYVLSDAVVARAGKRHVPVVATLGLSWDTVQTDSAARRRTRSVTVDNVLRLRRAGARIITGSDTYSSAEAIRNDVAALRDALNASPLELLRLRAVETPRVILPDRAIGELRPGFEASLLALACDPLIDVACQGRIVSRLKQGAWLLLAGSAREGTQKR